MASMIVEGKTDPTFKGPLAVPNVQELVRENFSNVPPRYIREQNEIQKATDKNHLSDEIPVIDLSLLANDDIEELKRLDYACEEWGFFQLINHGVSSEVMQKMKQGGREFFDLSLEDRNKYSQPPHDVQGYGHPYVVSDQEEQKLDWLDLVMLITMPRQLRNLQLWPDTASGFKETIDKYSNELAPVGELLLGSISLNMGLEKSTLLRKHKDIFQTLRINYYPPCAKPDQVFGISPHSDSSSITILLQEDQPCALQISYEGEWVPVKPIPGAFVVNIGDVIEIWSNGKYKSIDHRALPFESVSRISYAYFFFPNDDNEIAPLNSMVKSEGLSDQKIKKVKNRQGLGKFTMKKMEGKEHTEMGKN